MPCRGPRNRPRLSSLSTSLALRMASWLSGSARALYLGPRSASRLANARARSSAENALSLRRAFSSGMVAKKTSSPISAICASGFELKSRLGGHGDFHLGELLAVGLVPLAGGFEFIVRRGRCLGQRGRSQHRGGKGASCELHKDSLLLMFQGFHGCLLHDRAG